MIFKHWPILPKIITISLISVTMITLLVMLYFLPLVEKKVMEGKAEATHNVVDVAYGILAEYDNLVKSGKFTLPEGQQRALTSLRNLRYGEKEYFWINDLTPRMVMHPTKPELEGKELNDFTDSNGKTLFREFVKTAREKGGGYVTYTWPKPGESSSIPKISYVKLYQPWGWIIGSGVYVDDVAEEMARLRIGMIISTVLFALITLTLALIVGRGVTHPLKKVIDGLRDIASGQGDVDLTKRIDITTTDEIGILSGEFNELMESINNLTIFKKIIEEDDTEEEVYSRLGYVFTHELGFIECCIFKIENTCSKMKPVYVSSNKEEGLHCSPDILEDCELCKAQKTGHAISSFTYPQVCKQFLPSADKEHFCTPINLGGKTVAVVQFVLDTAEHDRNIPKGTNKKLYKAEQYVKESLPVIQAKQLMATLRESAHKDSLTGLHNRRFLQECAIQMVAGVQRRGKQIGLIMCDLDFFKQVNDQYGHIVGDMVLRETADMIKNSVRQSDLVIRFGGEEFLVVLIDIRENEAETIAEKIRKRIESHQISVPDGTLVKTISLGTSEFPADTDSFWNAIKFADVALLKAKEMGRNQTVKFKADMWKSEQF